MADEETPKKKGKRGGARRGISIEVYRTLIDFFRENPGRTTKAGEFVGINERTARKAWLQGCPHLGDEAPPIKTLIEEEKVRLRAAMEAGKSDAERKAAEEAAIEEYRAKERAKRQLAEARAEEAKMVKGNRHNVIGLTAVSAKMLRGMLKSADKLERLVATGKDTNGKTLTVRQQTVILNRISLLVERCASAGRTIIQTERILMGEPTEIIGHKVEGVTLEEAEAKTTEAQEMIARVRARRERKLVLIEGGKTGTDDHANR